MGAWSYWMQIGETFQDKETLDNQTTDHWMNHDMSGQNGKD